MHDFKIDTITQEDSTGCGIACIAMVTGKSYQEVKEIVKTEPNFAMTPKQLQHALEQYKMAYIPYSYPVLWPGRVYIITVPSLNILGGGHYMVIDYRNEDSALLHDPNLNKEGKKVYGYDADLQSYSEVIEVCV